MSTRYTISHADTHQPLEPRGESDSRGEVLAVLAAEPGIVPTEWYVTAWDHEALDAHGEPEILWQVSADEFVECGGRVLP